jgi:hypothetical protein
MPGQSTPEKDMDTIHCISLRASHARDPGTEIGLATEATESTGSGEVGFRSVPSNSRCALWFNIGFGAGSRPTVPEAGLRPDVEKSAHEPKHDRGFFESLFVFHR